MIEVMSESRDAVEPMKGQPGARLFQTNVNN
jgi:hypothetical protein